MTRTLPFLLLLAAGYLLRRLPGVPRDTGRSLNLYVIYVALPALVLIQVPRLEFSEALAVPVLMPWLVVLFSGTMVALCCRVFRWSREITGALLLMVPLGNTAFLGIPMVETFFGLEGVKYAILYDQFGSFLALSTYGTFLLAVYGGGERPGFLSLVRRIVLFPPFIALLLGLGLRTLSYPPWLQSLLSLTAGSLVPVVMVAIGFQLHLRLEPAERLPLLFGLFFRLVAAPLVFLGLCRVAGLEGEPVQVALFETAMPPMVAAAALASIAGLKPRLTSALVGYGILASFATLPLFFQLL
ncbi:MAG: AEC family transporter [Desulfobulbaceae bacterium]